MHVKVVSDLSNLVRDKPTENVFSEREALSQKLKLTMCHGVTQQRKKITSLPPPQYFSQYLHLKNNITVNALKGFRALCIWASIEAYTMNFHMLVK